MNYNLKNNFCENNVSFSNSYQCISLHESDKEPNVNSLLRLERSTCILWDRPYWHEQLEIMYFTEGNGLLMCGGTEYLVSPGNIYIVNCNELHYFSNSDFTVNYCITIEPEFFKNIKIEHIVFESVIRNDTFIQNCIIDAFKEFYQQEDNWDMAVMGKTYELMTYILRNYKKYSLSKNKYKTRNTKQQLMQNIIKYVSKNYNQRLTTASLAEAFHINEQYLCRIFKSETSQTVLNYINNLRVKSSLPLIKNTNEPISVIAQNVGFDDVNYFSRTFKKYIKMTPSEYRKG
ncbi:MAG: AraC family transcriptional regulator [Eubacteriales bacterium]|nr:AraC family transcriptional regulator [Eubacteriales bacterium]